MRELLLLVATMSGTAEFVADEISDSLRAAGLNPRLLKAETATVEEVAAAGSLLVCTSTYGTGEVPDGAKALVEHLTASALDLQRMRYGIIALGDMKYPASFCGGGAAIDSLLTQLGARRVGEICQIDASSGLYPEEVAAEWTAQWIPLLLDEPAAGA